jgi:hypothetical protein
MFSFRMMNGLRESIKTPEKSTEMMNGNLKSPASSEDQENRNIYEHHDKDLADKIAELVLSLGVYCLYDFPDFFGAEKFFHNTDISNNLFQRVLEETKIYFYPGTEEN